MKRLAPLVPRHSIRWYGPGENCADPAPGDMLLVDHGTFVDRSIGVGERILAITEPDLKPYVWCRHAALAVEKAPTTEGVYLDSRRGPRMTAGIVSEMGPRGHEYRAIEDYEHRLYAVVHFEVDDQARAQVTANDAAMHDIEYGWLQYAAFTVDGFTASRLSLAYGSAMICSTEVTMALMGCGFFPDRPPALVIPAHLARYVDARPPA